MKVIIVGGGAAGLMAASILRANNKDIEITILEKAEHVGKKLLITGNGRCNMGNSNLNSSCYNNEAGYLIASSFDVKEYFEGLGLLTTTDSENRIYPNSLVSNNVLDVLRESLENVEVINNFNVTNISKNTVYGNMTSMTADYIIVATGGKTYYKETNSYMLASKLSHRVTALRPSLLPIKIIDNLASIENLRAKVKASLICDDKVVYEDKGEVLFKKDAISGIVMFQLSAIINRNPLKHYKVSLDLLPEYSLDEITSIISNHPTMSGMFPKMITSFINKKAKCNDPYVLAYTIKNLEFDILDNVDFKAAQVTSGGVSLNELNEKLESKFNKNVYFVGEVVDVDGICGGYNLQFAFASANLVANDILRKVNENE